MAEGAKFMAQAISDADDRLLGVEEPLRGLQLRCGGEIDGVIAIPALLAMVRKSRAYGLKLARPLHAQDGQESITAWVEVEPRHEEDGDGSCLITVKSWQTAPLPPESLDQIDEYRRDIDRALAELSARLDAGQCLLAVETLAPDLEQAVEAMRGGIGRPWTDFVEIEGSSHRQPMHWRLLDGAPVCVPGSSRSWRAHLFPYSGGGGEPEGFELCLTAQEPLHEAVGSVDLVEPDRQSAADKGRPETAPMPVSRPGLVGRDVAPVLRQPIARIIANAETIRSRLAGPLADDYGNYAADIAIAGQHLLTLLDDLADLEIVEAEDFHTAPDHVDLADVARRAAGILGVRAREKGIVIDAPRAGESLPAIAEFRRVLQVLLNLVGNAIRYSPPDSQIWIRLEDEDARARVIVADQGPGLELDQQASVFEKFERLGRSGDGGSGLGLYISRRLARAMGGELSVESAPGQGARFILDLPAGPDQDSPEDSNG